MAYFRFAEYLTPYNSNIKGANHYEAKVMMSIYLKDSKSAERFQSLQFNRNIRFSISDGAAIGFQIKSSIFQPPDN